MYNLLLRFCFVLLQILNPHSRWTSTIRPLHHWPSLPSSSQALYHHRPLCLEFSQFEALVLGGRPPMCRQPRPWPPYRGNTHQFLTMAAALGYLTGRRPCPGKPDTSGEAHVRNPNPQWFFGARNVAAICGIRHPSAAAMSGSPGHFRRRPLKRHHETESKYIHDKP